MAASLVVEQGGFADEIAGTKFPDLDLLAA